MTRVRTLAALVVPFALVAIPRAANADVCSSVGTLAPALGRLIDEAESGGELTDGVCTDEGTTPNPDPTTNPQPEPTAQTAPSPVTTTAPVVPIGTGQTDTTDPVATDDTNEPATQPTASSPNTVLRIVRIAASLPLLPLSVAGFLLVVGSLALGASLGRRGVEHRVRKVADAQVEAVLALVPEGVIVTDADGRVRQINAHAASLVRLEPEKARGEAVATVLRGTDSRGGWLPAWVRANAQRSGATTATLDGAERIPVAIAASKYPGGNVFVLRDLRRERALERMKTEFLANVGHELRTPLTSALGFAQMLRERELSPVQRVAFVDAIVDACRKLSRVVDLLIDVASIEGGGFSADTDEVDLGELVRQSAHAWQGYAPEHVFAEEISPRRSKIRANAPLVRHALDELIDNAVKFSPEGGVITIGVASRTQDGRALLELTVSDQGIGIGGDEIDELFGDFTQADGSSTRSFGGLGLGLAFVRRVAALHGANVHVTSEPGKGSTFSIAMPVKRSLTQQVAADDATPQVRRSRAPRPAAARAR